MSNLSLSESHPDASDPAGLGAFRGVPRPRAGGGPSILDDLVGRFGPGPSCGMEAGGAAGLMVQVTRDWETDGGAVLGPADEALDVVVAVVAAPDETRIEIAVRGELDLSTVPALRVAVAGACRAEGSRGPSPVLVLDLAEVTFMDSAALHALADIDADVAGRGWSLRVTPPAGRGPRVLLLLATQRRWLPRWRSGPTATTNAAPRRLDAPPSRRGRCDGSSLRGPRPGSVVA